MADLATIVTTISITDEVNGGSSTYPIGVDAGNVSITLKDGTTTTVKALLEKGLVRSVNSKQGDVTLSAADLNAVPATTTQEEYVYGIPTLGSDGKIKTGYLPAGLWNVVEANSIEDFPPKGKVDTIYVATSTNKTYRWTGSQYTEISASLTLSYDSNPNTAYPSDRGKISYDHAVDADRLTTAQDLDFYKIATTAEGHIKAVEKADIPTTFPTNIRDEESPTIRSIIENAIEEETNYSFEGNTVTVISNQATGNFAHAEGLSYNNGTSNFQTKATGEGSHAEGIATQALGKASHAGGRNTIASGDYQTVIGKNNIDDNAYIFLIGDGTTSQPKNIFGVKKDNGTLMVNGVELNSTNITKLNSITSEQIQELTNSEVNQIIGKLN